MLKTFESDSTVDEDHTATGVPELFERDADYTNQIPSSPESETGLTKKDFKAKLKQYDTLFKKNKLHDVLCNAVVVTWDKDAIKS